MNENQHSEIIYEEGWRENARVELSPEPSNEIPLDEKPPAPAAEKSRPYLITAQLILCILLALFLFLLKSMDSGLYRDFMTFYRAELRKPIVSQQVFDSIDEGLFGNLTKASADEAETR